MNSKLQIYQDYKIFSNQSNQNLITPQDQILHINQLAGLQRRLIFALHSLIEDQNTKITEVVNYSTISDYLNMDISNKKHAINIRKSLYRLIEKNFIKKLAESGKKNKCFIFKLNNKICQQVVNKKYKNNNQKLDKYINKNINAPYETDTRQTQDPYETHYYTTISLKKLNKRELPEIYFQNNMVVSFLFSVGFCKKSINDIFNQFDISEKDYKNSLENFSKRLANKSLTKIKNPVNYFASVIKRGNIFKYQDNTATNTNTNYPKKHFKAISSGFNENNRQSSRLINSDVSNGYKNWLNNLTMIKKFEICKAHKLDTNNMTKSLHDYYLSNNLNC